MIIALATNQTLVAAHGQSALITTDPVPLSDFNYGDATFKTHVLFAGAGTPDIDLAFQLQGSNDGGNSWFAIPSFDGLLNLPGQVDPRAQITAAQFRAQFTLTVDGNPGDWAVATFDCHIHLTNIQCPADPPTGKATHVPTSSSRIRRQSVPHRHHSSWGLGLARHRRP